jgi:purine-binding chemotaxis protein CheW
VNIRINANEVIYGSFCLGKLELAINARELQEVVKLPDDLVEVPLAPDYFIGVFSLRQSIVPVIDMRALLQQPDDRIQEDVNQDCVAIIRVGTNRLGLLFDRTSEVLRINHEQIGTFEYAKNEIESKGPIQGVITLAEGTRLIQVIDPLALMNLPDVPLSADETADEPSVQHTLQTRRRCITFTSSGNRYAFRIDAVSEIIPMEAPQPTGLGSKLCIGQIELRGTKLPVLDFSTLLGGTAAEKSTDQNRIVIVRIDTQPVGFRVDQVEGITEYYDDELQSLPDFGEASSVVLAGCIVVNNTADISVIDHDKLFSMPEVTTPATAILESNQYAHTEEQVAVRNEGGIFTTYLVVNLGFDFVLPVAEIAEIIDCPSSISSIPGAPEYIDGIFNLREKVVTVVSMRRIYNVTSKPRDLQPKLLIVEHDDRLIGLRVDGVKDIVKIRAGNLTETPTALLRNWSQACKEDIRETLMDDSRVLPLLPLSRVLYRISPGQLESPARQSA